MQALGTRKVERFQFIEHGFSLSKIEYFLDFVLHWARSITANLKYFIFLLHPWANVNDHKKFHESTYHISRDMTFQKWPKIWRSEFSRKIESYHLH